MRLAAADFGVFSVHGVYVLVNNSQKNKDASNHEDKHIAAPLPLALRGYHIVRRSSGGRDVASISFDTECKGKKKFNIGVKFNKL